MNHKKILFSRLTVSVATVLTALLTLAPGVAAGPILITVIDPSGGSNNQPVYQVSNLAQGDSFNLDWYYQEEDNMEKLVDISATGMVSVAALSSTNLVLDIMLTNTSQLDQEIRATIFGLEVEGLTGLNSTVGGALLDTLDTAGTPMHPTFPEFMDVNVCATSGTNCAGGGGDGIEDMSTSNFTDSFTFNLAGTFGSTVTLSQFALKFQTAIDVFDNSYELPGVPTPKASVIPEPSTLFLLGLGLVGVGLIARRKSR